MYRSKTARMTKCSRWSLPTSLVVLGLLGCGDRKGDEGGDEVGCEWVESEVSMNFRPEGSELPSPAELLEAAGGEYVGELRWLGGAPWAEMTPSAGSTSVQTRVSRVGRISFRRTLEEDGRDAVFGNQGGLCLASYEIETTLEVATGDGVLEEAWGSTLSHRLLSNDTTLQVEVDDDLRQALRIEDAEEPPAPFENGRLDLRVSVSVRRPPGAHEATGVLSYTGQLASDVDGDVMEESGFRVQLLEWNASPVD